MVTRYRTIFISDVHLGSRACDAEALLDFLRTHTCDYLFLIGDIVDLWALSRRPFWPTAHNTVIQKVLRKARHGTHVTYIPGNHDDPIRSYDGYVFGDVKVAREAVHQLADGRRFLLVHGDDYDIVTRYHEWVARLGSVAYDLLLFVNSGFTRLRRGLGFQSHWSLSAYIKHKVKNVVQFVSGFEESVVASLRHRDVDGVICGHIHHATIRQVGGFTYVNTGDWVESCTAVVEDDRGELKVVRWKVGT